ncbi:MAG: hypothetical protein WCJ02_01630 [bacterium]
MNLNLITILIGSSLSLHVLADRNSDRGGRWGGGQSDSTSPRTESAAPARYTPAPTARYEAPQATERTYVPSQQVTSERTYTPSQTFKSEPTRTRTEAFQTQEPQRQTQQRVTVTPRYEQTVAPSVARTQPVAQAQPTQPVAMPQQPIITPRTTVQGSRSEPEWESRAQSTRNHPEREKTAIAQTQPAVQPSQATQRNTFQGVRADPEHTSRVAPTARDHFEHEKPAIAQAQPVADPTKTTPRAMSPSREISTQRHEQPRTVQITPPRTDRRITEKEHSPFIFEGNKTSRHEREGETTPTPIIGTSPISQAQHQAVSLRSPQHADSRTREPDHYREATPSHSSVVASRSQTRYPTYNNNYYSHHYPSHTDQYYRPVTSYNRSASFWQAFGFTIGASLLAPFYIAPVVYPSRSYYGTTWYGSPVVVSVSPRSHYPTYAYRPYYCNTGYIHDGFHYSSAYYGGWRGNWYGGFSYIFNPFPVYSSYYLYDEPQTIVVQQPAPQVVYVNQPAQPATPPQESILDTATLPTQPQPAVEPATTAQTPPAEENTRCFCACKCNGRVPCICEYACGSEFAYSPEAYTLKGFSSYSESLNRELIWSSYAGLDRAEPESLVAAGATEQ